MYVIMYVLMHDVGTVFDQIIAKTACCLKQKKICRIFIFAHMSQASFLWDRGKQCRSRSDADPAQTPQNAASDQGLHIFLTEC